MCNRWNKILILQHFQNGYLEVRWSVLVRLPCINLLTSMVIIHMTEVVLYFKFEILWRFKDLEHVDLEQVIVISRQLYSGLHLEHSVCDLCN